MKRKFIEQERRKKIIYYKSKENKIKQQGVTLIALVVTIVILIILAAVSINMIIGDNGIITQAQRASIENENGIILENLSMKASDIELSYYVTGSESTFILQELKNKGYVNDDNTVNVSSIATVTIKTGKGTNNKDIYKLEKNDSTSNYDLIYYDEKGNANNLGDVFKERLNVTSADYFDFNPTTGSISAKDANSYYVSEYSDIDVGNFPITEIVIPEEINGVKVTSIGNYYDDKNHIIGFYNLKNITSVYIPSTVEKIGTDEDDWGMSKYQAFYRCENLKTVTIANGVKHIGEFAFSMCPNLTNINIPETINSINSYAFAFSTKIKEITIPSSVTTMRQ